ncbi:MAG: quaternary ammonium compound efflux SMR transporter SugE [Deltaproteobacteria bacterium]|nr:quaternary ammonium compound efflux SMR transporter SugE [Deltaproteobacteria bacterium]
MAWTYLFVAGILEIAWAVGLKYSDGFTRLNVTIPTVTAMAASFYFLAQAIRVLPIGTAYAIWTGIGAAGTAVAGMILWQESREVARLLCLLLIITGIIGLKLTAKG